MRRLRALILIAALASFGTIGVAAAQAEGLWAGNGYFLASGQNGFLNHTVELEISTGIGNNRAVCAGIRGYADECAPRGSAASEDLEKRVKSEPYLHNHDTEGGTFEGWWWN